MTQSRFSAAGLSSRVLTGLILAGVLIVCWIVGGWFLFALVTAVCMLAQWEFYSMTLAGLSTRSPRDAALTGCALGLIYLVLFHVAPGYPPHLTLAAVTLVVGLVTLFSWNKEDGLVRLGRAAIVLAGILYIPVLLGPALRYSSMEQLLIVAVPALSDVAAYFAGVAVGKHKIWPTVSPKKSVEGAAAGLATAVTVCCLIGGIYGSAPLGAFAALGLALGVMSQLGDFFESALKRTMDVKDSSNLLPGHGGVLDRIDSILFACATYAIASGWMPFFA